MDINTGMDRDRIDGVVRGTRDSLPTVRAIAEIARIVQACNRFAVTTHERSDGDAIGSLLALRHALAPLGK